MNRKHLWGIDTREDLVREYAGELAVELGVQKGHFSKYILESTQATLYSIDAWGDTSRGHGDGQHQMVQNRLAEFGNRSIVVRSLFSDALDLFNDGVFDFIYIDGYAHDGQDNGRTIRDWWPKLKAGGVYAGHDYVDQYPETIAQVDSFVKDNGLVLYTTKKSSRRNPRSWFVFKEPDATNK